MTNNLLTSVRRSIVGGASKHRYLFRDEFTTDLAAGSVDETACEPGPGTRNVVDTGSFLPLVSGVVATTDATATGDPSIYIKEPIARAAGRMGWGWMKRNARGYIGFEDANSGSPAKTASAITATNLVVRDAELSIDLGETIAVNQWYEYLHALREAGAFYFVRGQAFTNMTLVYIGDADATATLYYGGADRVSGADLTAWKSFRIPKKLWLPTPIASDGMSALGTTDGAGHAEGIAGGLGAGGTGLAWTDQVGAWEIAAGARNSSALAGGLAICTVPTGTDDLYIDVECTRVGSELGIAARYTDGNNYLRAYHDGVNAVLDEVVAGAPNNLITAANAYAAGAVLALSLEGQTARLIYNKVYVGKTAVINAGLTATNAGLYTTDIANTFDDFRVYARGTGGEYNYFF